MAKSKPPIKIPFDHKGNLLDYVSAPYPRLPSGHWEDCLPTDQGAREKYDKSGYYHRVDSGEWRDNYVFSAILTVTGSERGRSAARVVLQDEQGHRYIMFLTDTVHLLQNAKTIAYGDIEGDWTFQKRGSNYGIKLAL